MADLAQLIERVEKLTGPDREVDLTINMALCPVLYEGKWSWDEQNLPPPLTASLDAAVALTERVLPNCWPTVDKYSTGDTIIWRAWIRRLVGDTEGDGPVANIKSFGKSSIPAIALILALLRALKEQNHG